MNANNKKGHKRKGRGRPRGPLRRTVHVRLTPDTIAKLGDKPALKVRAMIERLVQLEIKI